MGWVLLGYCVILWCVSAWSMWQLGYEEWEEWAFLPRDVQIALQCVLSAILVLFAPVWMPVAVVEEWLNGEGER